LEAALGANSYSDRLEALVKRLLALPLNPAAGVIRYPGERRWTLRSERLRHGIPLSDAELTDAMRLAKELGIPMSM
jgi:LDH2 family malate/lactate/ureidoglycolate dehydrogenase